MTKKLAKKLIADGYKIIIKSKENEFGAAKTEDINDETVFDIYELDKYEHLKTLEIGKVYKLEELV